MTEVQEQTDTRSEALPFVELRVRGGAMVCSESDGIYHTLPAEYFTGRTFPEGIVIQLGGVSIAVESGSLYGELKDGDGKTVAQTAFVREQWALERLVPAALPVLDRRKSMVAPHAALLTLLGCKPRVKFS